MKRAKPAARPEQNMTRAEAVDLAGLVAAYLEDPSTSEALQALVLLLRYLAYKGTKDDAETVYIMTETAHAADFPSVEDAILCDLSNLLAKRRAVTKGGA